jgi:hypothetical protein
VENDRNQISKKRRWDWLAGSGLAIAFREERSRFSSLCPDDLPRDFCCIATCK